MASSVATTSTPINQSTEEGFHIHRDEDNNASLMNHHPGPINLIYGSESPIKLADVSFHISSARKRRRPIQHLSFLGCQFHEGARAVFRKLGKKLQRVGTATTPIQELAISGIRGLGDVELASLAPFLNSNTTLRSLDLTGATFTSAAIHELHPFFSLNKSLEVLVLGENPCIGDDGVHVLVASLTSGSGGGSRLQVLAMDSCGLGFDGVASISNFITHYSGGKSLRVLELSRNYIGDYGAEILADALLCGEQHLGQLCLNDAEIGDNGAFAVARMLLSNQSLITLSLRNNIRITNLGASSLLDSVFGTPSIMKIIQSNHTLKSLSLKGCTSISPNLIQLATWHSLHSRFLNTKDAIIRWKVEYHLKKADCGLGVDDFDLELMPHLLALFGKSTDGMTSIFYAIKSTPQLYTMYEPEAIIVDETPTKNCEPDKKNETFFDQFKSSPSNKSAKKFYAVFVNWIPKNRSIIWNRNSCMRVNREPNISNVLSLTSEDNSLQIIDRLRILFIMFQ